MFNTKMHTSNEYRITVVTYENKITGETYELGMRVGLGHNSLETAWNHVRTACQVKGWNKHDVRPIAAT